MSGRTPRIGRVPVRAEHVPKISAAPSPSSAFGQDRPKLVVIENIEIGTRLDPYLDLQARHPVPHYRVAGKILVRKPLHAEGPEVEDGDR